jgi:hypothetical protein
MANETRCAKVTTWAMTPMSCNRESDDADMSSATSTKAACQRARVGLCRKQKTGLESCAR